MDRCFAQIVIEENQTDNKCGGGQNSLRVDKIQDGVDTLYQLAIPKPLKNNRFDTVWC